MNATKLENDKVWVKSTIKSMLELTLQSIKENKLLFLVVGLVALSRFVPHPPNFSAVGALALFGGAVWANKKWALWLPVALMMVTDIFVGLHVMMIFVYLSFALIAYFGTQIKKPGVLSVGIGAVLAAALFFSVTNFGVWLMTDMYPKTAEGLIASYVAGIPFFHNTLVSNLLFSSVLFSLNAALSKAGDAQTSAARV